MKRILFILSALVSFSTYAQKHITGNGNITRDERVVGNFTGITVHGSMNVQLSYGKPGNITVEADDNLLPYLETVVEKGHLVIRTKNKMNLKQKGKMTVYITATQVNNITLSGSGNIKGTGNFEAVGNNKIIISGSGNINLSYASLGDLTLGVSGSGNINLKGKNAESISASISGSGNIDAGEIAAASVLAQISGSGNIKVFASNTLDAKVSGSGNVYYKGDPEVTSKTAGSGKILKV